ncbi:hypothetical protein [Flammeovirga sp. SubArs3]|uniref:hypothetical protein n=1 Tax=Flammeovirga sp. SubArs3 TaxID=2995316 RepID=UPI00248C15CA|nr:hypothetical protein [Flammeovirga sp. SubArs3]
MKNLLFFVILLSSISFCKAQEITDFPLGKEFTEEKDMIRMDVGGIEGTLFVYTNKKKQIVSLGFVPSLDGTNPNRVHKQEFMGFIQYLQVAYGIQFEKTYERTRGKEHFTARTADMKIAVTIETYKDDLTPTPMTMMINKRAKN